ncbi:MAG: hypothetical protein WCL23_01185 [Candidatus Moraniibacteriota bacterium]
MFKELSKNIFLNKELQYEVPTRKLPFIIRISGNNVEINVEYKIEPERIVGICGECGEENKILFREKVSGEPVVISENQEAIVVAQEKIRELVEGVENNMLCCEDCFTEEFRANRPKRYLEAMRTVSQELEISIDMKKLESAISG